MSDHPFKDLEDKENERRKAMGLPPLPPEVWRPELAKKPLPKPPQKGARKEFADYSMADVEENVREHRELKKNKYSGERLEKYMESYKIGLMRRIEAAIAEKSGELKPTDSIVVSSKEGLKSVPIKDAQTSAQQTQEPVKLDESIRERMQGASSRELFKDRFPSVTKLVNMFATKQGDDKKEAVRQTEQQRKLTERNEKVGFALEALSREQEITVKLLRELLDIVKRRTKAGNAPLGGGGPGLGGAGSRLPSVQTMLYGGLALGAAASIGVGMLRDSGALTNPPETNPAAAMPEGGDVDAMGLRPEGESPPSPAAPPPPAATNVRAESGTFRRDGTGGSLSVTFARTADGKHYIDDREVDAETYNRFMQLTRGDAERDPKYRQYVEEATRNDDFAPEMTARARVSRENSAELFTMVERIRTQPRVERPATPAAAPAAPAVTAVPAAPPQTTQDASGPEGTDVGGLGLRQESTPAQRSFVGGEVSSRRARSGNLTIGGLSIGFSASADGQFVINGQEVDESTFNRFIEIKDRQVELLDSEGAAAKRNDMVNLMADIRFGRTPQPAPREARTAPSAPPAPAIAAPAQPARTLGGGGGDLATGFAGGADASAYGLGPEPAAARPATRVQRRGSLTIGGLNVGFSASGDGQYTIGDQIVDESTFNRFIEIKDRQVELLDSEGAAAKRKDLIDLLADIKSGRTPQPVPRTEQTVPAAPITATPIAPIAASQPTSIPTSPAAAAQPAAVALDSAPRISSGRQSRITGRRPAPVLGEGGDLAAGFAGAADATSMGLAQEAPPAAAATRVQRRGSLTIGGLNVDFFASGDGQYVIGGQDVDKDTFNRFIEIKDRQVELLDSEGAAAKRKDLIDLLADIKSGRTSRPATSAAPTVAVESSPSDFVQTISNRESLFGGAKDENLPKSREAVVNEAITKQEIISKELENKPDMFSNRTLMIRARNIKFKGDEIEFQQADAAPQKVGGQAPTGSMSGGGGPPLAQMFSGGAPAASGGSGGGSGGGAAMEGGGGQIPAPSEEAAAKDLKFAPGVDKRIQKDIAEKVKETESASGKSLTITSGFRDPARNAAAGGARNSAHTSGKAVDIQFRGNVEDTVNLIQKASASGIGGIGVYRPGFVHLDTGPKRVWGPDYTARSIPDWAKEALQAHMTGQSAQTQASGGGESGGGDATMVSSDSASGSAAPAGDAGGGASSPPATPAPAAPTTGAEVAQASAENEVAARTPEPPAVTEMPVDGGSPTSPLQNPTYSHSMNDPGPVEPADAAQRYAMLFNMAA